VTVQVKSVSVEGRQVALFQLNRHQNVGCRHDRKEEVPGRHGGRTPESDDEAEVERMPHKLVWSGSHKTQILKLFSSKEAAHLLQTKWLEVADQEGDDHHDSPSNKEQDSQGHNSRGIFHSPDLAEQRLPKADYHQKHETREEHIGTAFGRR